MEDDTQTLVSKITFIDMPGVEVLSQDIETLRIKEGNTMNKGIIGLQNVLTDLSSGKVIIYNWQKDYAIYESSNLTRICKDMFGGNAITIAIFNLQYDDPVGSAITLRLIKIGRAHV